jgi:hypothetical protein
MRGTRPNLPSLKAIGVTQVAIGSGATSAAARDTQSAPPSGRGWRRSGTRSAAWLVTAPPRPWPTRMTGSGCRPTKSATNRAHPSRVIAASGVGSRPIPGKSGDSTRVPPLLQQRQHPLPTPSPVPSAVDQDEDGQSFPRDRSIEPPAAAEWTQAKASEDVARSGNSPAQPRSCGWRSDTKPAIFERSDFHQRYSKGQRFSSPGCNSPA